MILYNLFVPGRDLGVEGYTKDTLVTKLVELLAPEGPGHPNEVLTSDDEARSSPVKENHDDALQMARYFWWVYLTGSLATLGHSYGVYNSIRLAGSLGYLTGRVGGKPLLILFDIILYLKKKDIETQPFS